MIPSIIESLTQKAQAEKLSRKEIIALLFENTELKQAYTNDIRRSTLIGKITNEVLQNIGGTDFAKILAIGDIAYFGALKAEWESLVQESISQITASNLLGYDLTGQGTDTLRECLFSYMKRIYQSANIPHSMVSAILPTYGGTDGFVTILETVSQIFPKEDIRFIYPEASFLANIKIAETILGGAQCIKINKPHVTNFFFDKNAIDSLYLKTLSKEKTVNIYYITPVGNPTGAAIHHSELFEILEHIHSVDPKAFFIFDTVYVGLLQKGASKEMVAEILEHPTLLGQIIFTESLSKTLGMTGVRIGWIWTPNELVGKELKRMIILKKAGFSKMLDQFTCNLLANEEKIQSFETKVYDFWDSERRAFIAIMKETFAHIFDFSASPEICDHEGIYVLLKIKDPYSLVEVFSETGIIGVGIELSDGMYIRYAFGNVQYFS